MIKISELRLHDVINITDGKRLGMIKDIDIDVETGRIKAFILPGATKLFSFLSKSEEIVVPWEKIVRIGVDVILVELSSGGQPAAK
ncbi:MAG: hypothetical protein PWQ39_1149 [Thermacetogenium sp.]|nr:hypothetical protein [Thermacetogenium sp.]